jgi:hypothetical protein
MLTIFVICLQIMRFEKFETDYDILEIISPIVLAFIIEWGRFDVLKYLVWGVYGIIFISLLMALLYLHAKKHIVDTFMIM